MSSFKDLDETAVPDDIECGEQLFDCSFHPKGDFLACGLIDGCVEVWKYGLEENKKMLSVMAHDASCRGVEFSTDGNMLYTVSADCYFRGLDGSGKPVFKLKAHTNPINKLSPLTEHIFATGDDVGQVKIWDIRKPGDDPVLDWHIHEDFISGFAYSPEKNTLLSVSGDATLCAYDMRKGPGKDGKQGVERSEDQEAEMHCLTILKGGRKVVCGTQEGVLLVFTWDRWQDCSDRYPGHPETVDCMLKIDETTIMTGSSDGLIRAVSIQPNKMIGVLGDHEEFPVEGMCTSPDGLFLASFAHDNKIRFNDISMFVDDVDDEEEEEDGDDAMPVEGRKGGSTAKAKASSGASPKASNPKAAGGGDDESDEEFEDEDEDEGEDMDAASSDFDSGSSDDDGEIGGRAAGSGYKIKTQAEKFFSDL